MCLITKKNADRQTAEAVERVRIVNANALYERDEKIEKQQQLLLDKQAEVDKALQANGNLKRQLDEANKLLKDAADTNAELQQLLTRPSCDGCVNENNYRKCVSCARYPKLKDKYQPEGEPDAS